MRLATANYPLEIDRIYHSILNKNYHSGQSYFDNSLTKKTELYQLLLIGQHNLEILSVHVTTLAPKAI